MIKKTISILISFTLVWTSGGMLEAARSAPGVFARPSHLPQFQLQPPGQLGRIADYFNAPTANGKLVILIQDLHAHYGVQKNIAGLLEFLAQKLPVGAGTRPAPAIPFALAVEGASGPIDSSVMALFPDEKIKLAASDYLMREGELTGAEYFAIKRGIPNLLVGAENAQFYTAHRDLFRKTLADRQDLVATLKPLQAEIDELPRHVFHKNRALWDFHKQTEAYDKGEIGTVEFIRMLVDYVGAAPRGRPQSESNSASSDSNPISSNRNSGRPQGAAPTIDLKRDFPVLSSFVSSSRFGTMDQVRAATTDFLRQTQDNLSAEEKSDLKLLAKSKSTVAYYLYLRELVYGKKLFMAVSPELAQYMEYVHTAQTMGMDRVMHEAKELAFRIKLSMAKDGPAGDLVHVQHDLDLLLRLADLQATEYEVRDFSPRLNQFVALTKALLSHPSSPEAIGGGPIKSFDEPKIRRLISSSIDFYVMALVRNKPMIDNTLALVGRTAVRPYTANVPSPNVAVLVAGGFHTVQLTNMLRAKNFSYLVFTPMVDQITERDHELYIKRLKGDHLTPDEITSDAERKSPDWVSAIKTAGGPDLSPDRTALAKLWPFPASGNSLAAGFDRAREISDRALRDAGYLIKRLALPERRTRAAQTPAQAPIRGKLSWVATGLITIGLTGVAGMLPASAQPLTQDRPVAAQPASPLNLEIPKGLDRQAQKTQLEDNIRKLYASQGVDISGLSIHVDELPNGVAYISSWVDPTGQRIASMELHVSANFFLDTGGARPFSQFADIFSHERYHFVYTLPLYHRKQQLSSRIYEGLRANIKGGKQLAKYESDWSKRVAPAVWAALNKLEDADAEKFGYRVVTGGQNSVDPQTVTWHEMILELSDTQAAAELARLTSKERAAFAAVLKEFPAFEPSVASAQGPASISPARFPAGRSLNLAKALPVVVAVAISIGVLALAYGIWAAPVAGLAAGKAATTLASLSIIGIPVDRSPDGPQKPGRVAILLSAALHGMTIAALVFVSLFVRETPVGNSLLSSEQRRGAMPLFLGGMPGSKIVHTPVKPETSAIQSPSATVPVPSKDAPISLPQERGETPIPSASMTPVEGTPLQGGLSQGTLTPIVPKEDYLLSVSHESGADVAESEINDLTAWMARMNEGRPLGQQIRAVMIKRQLGEFSFDKNTLFLDPGSVKRAIGEKNVPGEFSDLIRRVIDRSVAAAADNKAAVSSSPSYGRGFLPFINAPVQYFYTKIAGESPAAQRFYQDVAGPAMEEILFLGLPLLLHVTFPVLIGIRLAFIALHLFAGQAPPEATRPLKWYEKIAVPFFVSAIAVSLTWFAGPSLTNMAIATVVAKSGMGHSASNLLTPALNRASRLFFQKATLRSNANDAPSIWERDSFDLNDFKDLGPLMMDGTEFPGLRSMQDRATGEQFVYKEEPESENSFLVQSLGAVKLKEQAGTPAPFKIRLITLINGESHFIFQNPAANSIDVQKWLNSHLLDWQGLLKLKLPTFTKLVTPVYQPIDFSKYLHLFQNLQLPSEGILKTPDYISIDKSLDLPGSIIPGGPGYKTAKTFETQPPSNSMDVTADYLAHMQVPTAMMDEQEMERLLTAEMNRLIGEHPEAEQELKIALKEIRSFRQMKSFDHLQVVARIMAAVIGKIKQEDPSQYILHFARDLGLNMSVQKALNDLSDGVNPLAGGAFYLNTPMMGTVYPELNALIHATGTDSAKLAAAVEAWFETRMSQQDPGFLALERATRISLEEMGVLERGKIVLMDTGFAGTMPWYAYGLIRYYDKHGVGPHRMQDRELQVVLVKSNNNTRQISAGDIREEDREVLAAEQSILNMIQDNSSMLTILEATGNKRQHPIQFSRDEQRIVPETPVNRLNFFFIRQVFLDMALAQHMQMVGVKLLEEKGLTIEQLPQILSFPIKGGSSLRDINLEELSKWSAGLKTIDSYLLDKKILKSDTFKFDIKNYSLPKSFWEASAEIKLKIKPFDLEFQNLKIDPEIFSKSKIAFGPIQYISWLPLFSLPKKMPYGLAGMIVGAAGALLAGALYFAGAMSPQEAGIFGAGAVITGFGAVLGVLRYGAYLRRIRNGDYAAMGAVARSPATIQTEMQRLFGAQGASLMRVTPVKEILELTSADFEANLAAGLAAANHQPEANVKSWFGTGYYYDASENRVFVNTRSRHGDQQIGPRNSRYVNNALYDGFIDHLFIHENVVKSPDFEFGLVLAHEAGKRAYMQNRIRGFGALENRVAELVGNLYELWFIMGGPKYRTPAALNKLARMIGFMALGLTLQGTLTTVNVTTGLPVPALGLSLTAIGALLVAIFRSAVPSYLLRLLNDPLQPVLELAALVRSDAARKLLMRPLSAVRDNAIVLGIIAWGVAFLVSLMSRDLHDWALPLIILPVLLQVWNLVRIVRAILADARKSGDKSSGTPPTGGAAKRLGLRDATDEDALLDLSLSHDQFEAQAKDLPVEDFLGVRARVVTARLPEGVYGYNFLAADGSVIVVVDPRIAGSGLLDEIIFHEVTEARYGMRGFNQHEAHVIASARQEQAFGRSGGLTPFHRQQLRTMPTDRLSALIAETEADRAWHHDVLQRAGFDAEDLKDVRSYETALREEARKEMDRFTAFSRQVNDVFQFRDGDDLSPVPMYGRLSGQEAYGTQAYYALLGDLSFSFETLETLPDGSRILLARNRRWLKREKVNLFLIVVDAAGQVIQTAVATHRPSDVAKNQYEFKSVEDSQLKTILGTAFRAVLPDDIKPFEVPKGMSFMRNLMTQGEIERFQRLASGNPVLRHLLLALQARDPGRLLRLANIFHIGPDEAGGFYYSGKHVIVARAGRMDPAQIYSHEIAHFIHLALAEKDPAARALIRAHFSQDRHRVLFASLERSPLYHEIIASDLGADAISPTHRTEGIAYIIGALAQGKVITGGYHITYGDLQVLIQLGLLPASFLPGREAVPADVALPLDFLEALAEGRTADPAVTSIEAIRRRAQLLPGNRIGMAEWFRTLAGHGLVSADLVGAFVEEQRGLWEAALAAPGARASALLLMQMAALYGASPRHQSHALAAAQELAARLQRPEEFANLLQAFSSPVLPVESLRDALRMAIFSPEQLATLGTDFREYLAHPDAKTSMMEYWLGPQFPARRAYALSHLDALLGNETVSLRELAAAIRLDKGASNSDEKPDGETSPGFAEAVEGTDGIDPALLQFSLTGKKFPPAGLNEFLRKPDQRLLEFKPLAIPKIQGAQLVLPQMEIKPFEGKMQKIRAPWWMNSKWSFRLFVAIRRILRWADRLGSPWRLDKGLGIRQRIGRREYIELLKIKGVRPAHHDPKGESDVWFVPRLGLIYSRKLESVVPKIPLSKGWLVPHSFVNGYISDHLPQGLKDRPESVEQFATRERGVWVIPIEGLFENTGQLAHVGLGRQYGEPVIYVDAQYRENREVLAQELYETDRWEEQRQILGLRPEQMRDWIRENFAAAKELADRWHREAPSIDHLLAGREAIGEDFASFYTGERDINIAAGPASGPPESLIVAQSQRAGTTRRAFFGAIAGLGLAGRQALRGQRPEVSSTPPSVTVLRSFKEAQAALKRKRPHGKLLELYKIGERYPIYVMNVGHFTGHFRSVGSLYQGYSAKDGDFLDWNHDGKLNWKDTQTFLRHEIGWSMSAISGQEWSLENLTKGYNRRAARIGSLTLERTPEETAFWEELVALGLIRLTDGRYEPVVPGSIVTASPSTLRHELDHAMFAAIPEYKAIVVSLWKSLDPKAQEFFRKRLTGDIAYKGSDEEEVIAEFSAYALQNFGGSALQGIPLIQRSVRGVIGAGEMRRIHQTLEEAYYRFDPFGPALNAEAIKSPAQGSHGTPAELSIGLFGHQGRPGDRPDRDRHETLEPPPDNRPSGPSKPMGSDPTPTLSQAAEHEFDPAALGAEFQKQAQVAYTSLNGMSRREIVDHILNEFAAMGAQVNRIGPLGRPHVFLDDHATSTSQMQVFLPGSLGSAVHEWLHAKQLKYLLDNGYPVNSLTNHSALFEQPAHALGFRIALQQWNALDAAVNLLGFLIYSAGMGPYLEALGRVWRKPFQHMESNPRGTVSAAKEEGARTTLAKQGSDTKRRDDFAQGPLIKFRHPDAFRAIFGLEVRVDPEDRDPLLAEFARLMNQISPKFWSLIRDADRVAAVRERIEKRAKNDPRILEDKALLYKAIYKELEKEGIRKGEEHPNELLNRLTSNQSWNKDYQMAVFSRLLGELLIEFYPGSMPTYRNSRESQPGLPGGMFPNGSYWTYGPKAVAIAREYTATNSANKRVLTKSTIQDMRENGLLFSDPQISNSIILIHHDPTRPVKHEVLPAPIKTMGTGAKYRPDDHALLEGGRPAGVRQTTRSLDTEAGFAGGSNPDTFPDGIVGAMHDREEGQSLYAAMQKHLGDVLRKRGWDRIMKIISRPAAQRANQPLIEKALSALQAAGISPEQAERMAGRIHLVNVAESRLVGDSDQLGGLIVRYGGQLQILFPRGRLANPNPSPEVLGDLLHELVEVELLEQGMQLDEAHAQALRVRTIFVDEAALQPSAAPKTQAAIANLRDTFRHGKFELTFDSVVTEALRRASFNRQSDLGALSSEQWHLIRQGILAGMRANGWSDSDRLQTEFASTLDALISPDQVSHFIETVGHFDAADLVIVLQRLHSLQSHLTEYGVRAEILPQVPLTFVLGVPVSEAQRWSMLRAAKLAGPFFDRAVPNQNTLDHLQRGEFHQVIKTISGRPVEQVLPEIRAIVEFFQIDIARLESNFMLNLARDVGRPVERLEEGERTQVGQLIMQHFMHNIMQALDIGENLKSKDVHVRRILARGFDGLIIVADHKGQKVVVKINIPNMRGDKRMDNPDELLSILSQTTRHTNKTPYFTENFGLSKIRSVFGDQEVVEINEYIEGPTLRAMLDRADFYHLGLSQILAFGNQFLAIHQILLLHGLINRDAQNLKNLIAESGARLVFVDFGNLKAINRHAMSANAGREQLILARRHLILATIKILTGQHVPFEGLALAESLEEKMPPEDFGELFEGRFGVERHEVRLQIYAALLDSWNRDDATIIELVERLDAIIGAIRGETIQTNAIVGAIHDESAKNEPKAHSPLTRGDGLVLGLYAVFFSPVAVVSFLVSAYLTVQAALAGTLLAPWGLVIAALWYATSVFMLMAGHAILRLADRDDIAFGIAYPLLSVLTGRISFIRSVRGVLDPRPADRILDLGSGTLSPEILRKGVGPEGLYVGMDRSALAVALDRRMARARQALQVHYLAGSAPDLPFAAKSFNKVVAVNPVYLSEKTARSIYDVLQDDGILYVAYDAAYPGNLISMMESAGFRFSRADRLRVWYFYIFPIKSGSILQFQKTLIESAVLLPGESIHADTRLPTDLALARKGVQDFQAFISALPADVAAGLGNHQIPLLRVFTGVEPVNFMGGHGLSQFMPAHETAIKEALSRTDVRVVRNADGKVALVNLAAAGRVIRGNLKHFSDSEAQANPALWIMENPDDAFSIGSDLRSIRRGLFTGIRPEAAEQYGAYWRVNRSLGSRTHRPLTPEDTAFINDTLNNRNAYGSQDIADRVRRILRGHTDLSRAEIDLLVNSHTLRAGGMGFSQADQDWQDHLKEIFDSATANLPSAQIRLATPLKEFAEVVSYKTDPRRPTAISYLNRSLTQSRDLRDHILPRLIDRAMARSKRDHAKPKLDITVFGAGTGEELARLFHEIAEGLQAHQQTISAWDVRIKGIDADPGTVAEGRRRLQGEAPFAVNDQEMYLPEEAEAKQAARRYGQAVLRTLNGHRQQALLGISLVQGDITNPDIVQAQAGSDLIVVNNVLTHVPMDQEEPVIHSLDRLSSAWVVIGGQRVAPDVLLYPSRHFGIRSFHADFDSETHAGFPLPAEDNYVLVPRSEEATAVGLAEGSKSHLEFYLSALSSREALATTKRSAAAKLSEAALYQNSADHAINLAGLENAVKLLLQIAQGFDSDAVLQRIAGETLQEMQSSMGFRYTAKENSSGEIDTIKIRLNDKPGDVRPHDNLAGGDTLRSAGLVAVVAAMVRVSGATWLETGFVAAEFMGGLLAFGLSIAALVWIGRRLPSLPLFARHKRLQAAEAVVTGAAAATGHAGPIHSEDHIDTIGAMLPKTDLPAVAAVRASLETATDYIQQSA